MASSKFNICSMALTKLGKKPISSFQEASNLEAAEICGLLWDDESNFLLSCYSWRFNSTKAQLARLADAPLNEWTYAYQMPSDKINVRAVYDSVEDKATPFTRFEIFGNTIYTDADIIAIDYQVAKDPIDWPYYFVQFAVAHFCSVLAPSMTNQNGIAATWDAMAWGPPNDNRKGGLFGVAKDIDSKIMPAEQFTNFELIAARFS